MKMLPVGLLLGVCACTTAAVAALAQPPAAVQVDHAWVHAAPKGQFETWGFATITNTGKADAIVAVRSADAGSVVLRATNVTDAGRKVRSVLSIPVPAAGVLALAPDSYFIAFIDARRAFAAGQSVTATLKFASGAVIPVAFHVVEAAADPADTAP